MDHLTHEQLDYALTGASDPAMWNLFAEDGAMKMYKREVRRETGGFENRLLDLGKRR